MKILILFSLMFLSSCSSITVQIASGPEITCSGWSEEACGFNLFHCDGPVEEYRCVHDLRVIHY